ncbi:MAG: methionine gamma-lyase family protein [Eubacteriales bacterium]|nr:methionine gamma-lyase family protein [Eubacteriales bacterium]
MDNIYASYGISEEIFRLSEQVMQDLAPTFAQIDQDTERRQLRVIQAMQEANLRESSLQGSTGYGSFDAGRDALEAAYASYFRTEAALVRMQFSSGTHVLATCLRGLLRPGQELLIVTSEVYDTLRPCLGLSSQNQGQDLGSLTDFGISHRQVDLSPEGDFDYAAIRAAISPRTSLIYVQKSLGYSERPCLLNRQIAHLVKFIKKDWPHIPIMVDNCYGEMVEDEEPTAYGVDICAGSLIKNLGAGLAESGGYVCGRQDLLDRVAAAMTAPGIGAEVGPSLGQNTKLIKGFYFAPHVVREALKSACHAAGLLAALGFAVFPQAQDPRGDIVQRIALGSPQALIKFCEQIQFASPVDASFAPVPAPMAGYDCDIIMASGSFVQGSSIELSCDGPLRPPYNAYLQGSLSFTNGRLAVMKAAQSLAEEGQLVREAQTR